MKGQNILVIKLGALGDFIQALGAMRAIRRHHPLDRIVLMTSAPFESLGRMCGYFDAVMVDSRPRWSDFRGWMALRRQLLAERFARVYDLQNNDRTAFYLRLFGFFPPQWVGAARGASHRNASPARTAGHALDGHAQTLALAGVEGVCVDDLSWMRADIARFDLKRPYALLVPGCSPGHPEKRWPPDFYAALAHFLIAEGILPVLLGAGEDRAAIAAILALCPGCVDLYGKTGLLEIPALARAAALAVGNDTGPIHMIGATGCPTVALFCGRSDPVRHAPKGAQVLVLRERVLSALSPERVMTALRALVPLPGSTDRAEFPEWHGRLFH